MKSIRNLAVFLTIIACSWSGISLQAVDTGFKPISKQQLAQLLKKGKCQAAYSLTQDELAKLAPSLAQDVKQSLMGKDAQAMALIFRDGGSEAPVGAQAGLVIGVVVTIAGLAAFGYGCFAESGAVITGGVVTTIVGAATAVTVAKMFFHA